VRAVRPRELQYAFREMDANTPRLFWRGGRLTPWTDDWSWALLCSDETDDRMEANPFVDSIDFDPVYIVMRVFDVPETPFPCRPMRQVQRVEPRHRNKTKEE